MVRTMKITLEEKKRRFNDMYNPIRVYTNLRYVLEIPKHRARELSAFYDDVFYKVVMKEVDNEEKRKSKLESNLHSHSRHSYP